MVFIPERKFITGKDGKGNLHPAHQVVIKAFYLDIYEVTNAAYYEFCLATQHHLPEFWGMASFHCGLDYPDYPVVGISWSDAQAYAKWVGNRLPTEAEWEYAARGRLVGKNYPNGNNIDKTQANFTFKGKRIGTRPSGSYPPNSFGLYDMAGNVVEWVADFYAADYYQNSPTENPYGPPKGHFRVIRGGGWHSGPYCNRGYYRNALPQNWVDFALGFRCARDAQ